MSYQTQEITMKKKKNKELPKWYDGANYTEGDTVTNPFSGESYELNANELAMYDLIKKVIQLLILSQVNHTN